MTPQTFESIVAGAFGSFLLEPGFQPLPVRIGARYYEAAFKGKTHTVIVGFEPGDDFVLIMLTRNGILKLAAIDDSQLTPRLSDLNSQYMNLITSEQRAENQQFFKNLSLQISDDKIERELIKYAKELRLVLPLQIKVLN